MKKTFFLLLGSALLLSIASCSQKGKCDKGASDDKVYTGIVPGADVSGVRYTVLMDFDYEDNDGDFDMISTYLRCDSTGIKDVDSFYEEGDFTIGKTPAGVPCYTLTSKKGNKTYFIADTDSTITMTGADFTPVAADSLQIMNYTLKEVKY